MSSTDSTELEDSNCQDYLKDEIEKQNFSSVLECVESVRRDGKELYLSRLKTIYKHSVSLYHFDFAESLFKMYPELLTHDYFLDPYNSEELWTAASVGHIGFMKFLLSSVGIAPKNKSLKTFNLFEIAVLHNQLDTAKFIWEELGICSSREELILRSIKGGKEALVRFLYEDVGIEMRHHYKCIMNAVKSGSLALINYLYDTVGIRAIEDVAIVELAIHQASKTGSLLILETLLKFEFKVKVRSIQPYNETTSYSYPLCLSMIEAAKRGYLDVIQFVYEVLKVELVTDDPSYVEMLKYAAEEAHEEVLRYLLEEVQLDPTLLPSQQSDSLLLIILNSEADDYAKQRMLQIVIPLESSENFAKVLEQTTDEQRLMLGRTKRKSHLTNGIHKVAKSDVAS
mmetsp:Transcript_27090/g.48587  ORF Transcript_27090/g.48587 Transcript_27090/m.48587 type:complete len:398 (+) Transcript_27090:1485-2678(+)